MSLLVIFIALLHAFPPILFGLFLGKVGILIGVVIGIISAICLGAVVFTPLDLFGVFIGYIIATNSTDSNSNLDISSSREHLANSVENFFSRLEDRRNRIGDFLATIFGYFLLFIFICCVIGGLYGWVIEPIVNYINPSEYDLQKRYSKLPFNQLQKECDEFNSSRCISLGLKHESEGQYQRAADAYKKACDQGFSVGCRFCAIMYMEGLLNTPELEQKFTLKACELKDGVACLDYSSKYNCSAEDSPSSLNCQLAKPYLELGCKYGNEESCRRLRLINKK